MNVDKHMEIGGPRWGSTVFAQSISEASKYKSHSLNNTDQNNNFKFTNTLTLKASKERCKFMLLRSSTTYPASTHVRKGRTDICFDGQTALIYDSMDTTKL